MTHETSVHMVLRVELARHMGHGARARSPAHGECIVMAAATVDGDSQRAKPRLSRRVVGVTSYGREITAEACYD